ncbi:unnamed protein product [Cuscuta epithymum]|uniref:Uncharacterized protein n=1 Tax=Cuscuta epithymum TaxID=186058 RepID=A0AAV0D2F1_9ASTE|nr:unnamed protein product [Cuscuta epithymum]
MIFFLEIEFVLGVRRIIKDKKFCIRKEWKLGFKFGPDFNPRFQNQGGRMATHKSQLKAK